MGGVQEWKRPIETGPIPESGKTFDVIVVGGGPGGSAAACYHAMAGCKVLLLEKEVWPRDKICGDALSGKSVRLMRELDLLDGLEQLEGSEINRITFGSPSHSQFDVYLKGPYQQGKSGILYRRD